MAQKVPNSPALLSITPPPPDTGRIAIFLRTFLQSLFDVLRKHAIRLNAMLASDGSEAMTAPLPLMAYNIAGLPPAPATDGLMVYVTDENVPGYSEGGDWRRTSDGRIVGSDEKVQLNVYLVAFLPDASTQPWTIIAVLDATPNPCVAISDGSAWRRVEDWTVVV